MCPTCLHGCLIWTVFPSINTQGNTVLVSKSWCWISDNSNCTAHCTSCITELCTELLMGKMLTETLCLLLFNNMHISFNSDTDNVDQTLKLWTLGWRQLTLTFLAPVSSTATTVVALSTVGGQSKTFKNSKEQPKSPTSRITASTDRTIVIYTGLTPTLPPEL